MIKKNLVKDRDVKNKRLIPNFHSEYITSFSSFRMLV